MYISRNKKQCNTHSNEEYEDGQEAEAGEDVGYDCWWALLWFTEHVLKNEVKK